MREICMLRAMWRGLEAEPRTSLHGHEGGNPGHRQGMSYGPPRQPSTLPPVVPVRERPGVQLALVLRHFEDRGHLPVIELRPAA